MHDLYTMPRRHYRCCLNKQTSIICVRELTIDDCAVAHMRPLRNSNLRPVTEGEHHNNTTAKKNMRFGDMGGNSLAFGRPAVVSGACAGPSMYRMVL